jgi:hypothetical protein
MALLYGRVGCLTAQNGVFGPGQCAERWLGRLNVCFAAESPLRFAERVAVAFAHR